MGKIPELSECDAGIAPMEYNVVVAPETIEQKTAGGVYLPDSVKETQELAATRARLVAVSPHAFSYADEWPEGSKPKVGDVVLTAKYAGTLYKGSDNREYRLCKDKDIAAVVL